MTVPEVTDGMTGRVALGATGLFGCPRLWFPNVRESDKGFFSKKPVFNRSFLPLNEECSFHSPSEGTTIDRFTSFAILICPGGCFTRGTRPENSKNPGWFSRIEQSKKKLFLYRFEHVLIDHVAAGVGEPGTFFPLICHRKDREFHADARDVAEHLLEFLLLGVHEERVRDLGTGSSPRTGRS